MRRIAGLCLLLLMAIATPPASAGDAAVLTVAPLGAPEIAFTIDDLRAMGTTALTTATPWTEGEQDFVGITGKQLLAALKARGIAGDPDKINAVANNDYSIIFPDSVFDRDDVLIAYSRNGFALPVRDKGPLWIVFPFDQDPKYRTNTYKSYAIWGLVRLELQSN